MMTPIFKSSLLVCALAACVFSTGCMTTPNTGDVIANKSQTVHFSGWTHTPSEKVDIYAYNFVTNNYQKIGTTYSTSSSVPAFGTEFSYWSKNITIPAQCWSSPGFFKSSAVLKARSAGADMICWEDGFADYVGEYDDLSTLYEERSAGTQVWIAAEN